MQGNQKGIVLCVVSMLIFASQDGITKALVKDLPIAQLVMIRYWAFLAFAVAYSMYDGGLRKAIGSRKPLLQAVRSVLGVADTAMFGWGLMYLGLAEMHALYAVFPLMTLALAGLLLREAVGVRRWICAVIGFAGTLVILRPGLGAFSVAALIPLVSAFGFALFSILTRYISRDDGFTTNMLYMGLFGALCSTAVGLPMWVSPTSAQWGLIGILSLTGVSAQMLVIQALRFAPAGVLQPFNYLLLVFATAIGMLVFGELPDGWTLAGAAVIVASGMYAFRARG